MRNPMIVPCSDWEEKLTAAHPEDLLPAEREALDRHIASCPACATAISEYRQIDALLRRSLTAKRPLELPEDYATARRQEIGIELPSKEHSFSHPSSAFLRKHPSRRDSQEEARPLERERTYSPMSKSTGIKSTPTARDSYQKPSLVLAGNPSMSYLSYAIRIYARCLSKYTEMLPDEHLSAEVLVEVHVGQVLLNLFEVVVMENVSLRYLPTLPMEQQLCHIQVYAQCQNSLLLLQPQVLDGIELTVEDAVSGILLELFGVVIIEEVRVKQSMESEVEVDTARFKSA
jgi:hypothetical protein